MGIPSYFSYIIKHHKLIVTKFNSLHTTSNFYLDSNSIIYDIAHKLNYDDFMNSMDFENTLIQRVCEKIKEYIDLVNPSNGVFIAFDGVPPLAKIVQQRERRYKGLLTHQLNVKLGLSTDKPAWNTVNITVGTEFMNHLNKELNTFFEPFKQKYHEFIISTSNDIGEGEHKIFHHIRNNQTHTSTIYGLDADLIILGLNHLQYSQIYLLRESKDFKIQSNDYMLLNLKMLENQIVNLLSPYPTDKYKIYDYILLSFFIGNDFIPKIPYINVHDKGLELLINTYKKSIHPNEIIFNGKTINWLLFKKLIYELSLIEHSTILEFYKQRNKFVFTSTDVTAKLNALPRISREVETYINPFDKHWEDRYYKKLFKIDYHVKNISKICKNYLEMFEWNMSYYTSGCKNWDTYYHYNYPPLFNDLLQFIPDCDIELVKSVKIKPITPIQLLVYVLPKEYLHLLPSTIYELVKNKHWYDRCDIEWTYCNFFWESSILCVDIPIKELRMIKS